MGVGLFKSAPTMEEFWKQFKKHMGYTDEELENFKKDPIKVKLALKLASPEVQNKVLVFEVVDVHGCSEGMRPGDKLYFKGGILLDTKRSDRWCAFSVGYAVAEAASVFQHLLLHDIDPNEIIFKVRSCGDCGPPLSKYGFGYVLYKIYVIDEGKRGGK